MSQQPLGVLLSVQTLKQAAMEGFGERLQISVGIPPVRELTKRTKAVMVKVLQLIAQQSYTNIT